MENALDSPAGAAVLLWMLAGVGGALGSYVIYAGMAWLGYGQASRPAEADGDQLLDRFMPDFEVRESHRMRVAAPADVTLAAAGELDLFGLPLVRPVFRAREWLLGGEPPDPRRPRGLLAETRALGWEVLAEVPGREIVVGAVTRPWEANVIFRAVPPDEFARFCEPGFVKIVWNLRADPVDAGHCLFRAETRVIATDSAARARFRRYWAFLSAGIVLIRWLSLRPIRSAAERRAQSPGAGPRERGRPTRL
ncbi:MAG: hypothetical protein JNG83_10435 [Opitutaceae bacterium]|nr:hypothetical protein [Opitutaceae bacterium]